MRSPDAVLSRVFFLTEVVAHVDSAHKERAFAALPALRQKLAAGFVQLEAALAAHSVEVSIDVAGLRCAVLRWLDRSAASEAPRQAEWRAWREVLLEFLWRIELALAPSAVSRRIPMGSD